MTNTQRYEQQRDHAALKTAMRNGISGHRKIGSGIKSIRINILVDSARARMLGSRQEKPMIRLQDHSMHTTLTILTMKFPT